MSKTNLKEKNYIIGTDGNGNEIKVLKRNRLGCRRYQNPDGTWTEEFKELRKKYSKDRSL